MKGGNGLEGVQMIKMLSVMNGQIQRGWDEQEQEQDDLWLMRFAVFRWPAYAESIFQKRLTIAQPITAHHSQHQISCGQAHYTRVSSGLMTSFTRIQAARHLLVHSPPSTTGISLNIRIL